MEIKVPVLPESVADATIATWHVKTGEAVSRDQVLVDIETDKVVLEVVAQADGVMGEIIHAEGATVLAEQVIGHQSEGAAPSAAPAAAAEKSSTEASAPVATADNDDALTPSVRRMIAEKGLDAAKIKGSGKNGRVTKEDVEKFLAGASAAPAAKSAPAATTAPAAVVGDRSQKRVPMT
ncbi:MAG: E3 binding domain-containing protein, partial [Gammaproteobacteria bacterium]|nr:E3 binding domain-containing protein [Gammaproteobacteria bacterium]